MMSKVNMEQVGKYKQTIFSLLATLVYFHFTLDPYLIMLSVKVASSTTLWVFGMTQPGIEPWSSRPLANTLLIRSLPMVWEIGAQSQVESYQRLKKMLLDAALLALSAIKWGSRVKWSNPGNGVAPSPTPRCSSYWKGSLRVTFD